MLKNTGILQVIAVNWREKATERALQDAGFCA